MKHLFLLFAGAYFSMLLWSAPVSSQNVQQTATNWLELKYSSNFQATNIVTVTDSTGTIVLYKIDFSPSGFVIIAADDCSYPILGYSNIGHITDIDFPAFNYLIDGYKSEISHIITQNYPNTTTLQVWSAVNARSITNRTQVDITMDTTWGQGDPYNQYCPYLSEQRILVGCPATAMSQIINYQKFWNNSFSESDSYQSNPLGWHIPIDNGHEDYDFPSFSGLNSLLVPVVQAYRNNQTLSSENKAALSFACAILVKTDFSTSGSGTFANLTIPNTVNAFEKNGYTCLSAAKSDYQDNTWKQMIVNDLNRPNPSPIFYAGDPANGNGHAFIVHGYNNDNSNQTSFHLNWGWYGDADGWFTLDDLTPNHNESEYNFTHNQKMIYQITTPVNFQQHVVFADGSFSGIATLYLTDSNGIVQQFTSDDTGIFNCDVAQPGIYDLRIAHSDGYHVYQTAQKAFIRGYNQIQSSAQVLGIECSIRPNILFDNNGQLDRNCVMLLNEADGTLINQYTSDNIGNFDVVLSSTGPYDITIKRQSDGNSYEWYQKYNVTFNSAINTLEPQTVVLNYNPDKIISVPTDYSSIQDALYRIQDGGTVIVHGNSTDTPYACDGLKWKYKHVKLISSTTPRAILRGDQVIKLEWSGINNNDQIKNFKFQNCITYLHGAAITLKSGASPIIDNCQFINNTLRWRNLFEDPPIEQAMGAAVYLEGRLNQTVTPKFTNCLFQENKCMDGIGGGALGLAGPAYFEQCIFENNRSDKEYDSSITSFPSAGVAYINTAMAGGDVAFSNCDFIHTFGFFGAREIDISRCDYLSNIIILDCRFDGIADLGTIPGTLPPPPSIPAIQILHNDSAIPLYGHTPALTFMNNKFTNYANSGILMNDFQGRMFMNISKNLFNLTGFYGVELDYHGDQLQPVYNNYFTFNNNTVIGANTGLILHKGADYTVNNCLFDNQSGYSIQWAAQNQHTHGLTINNCLFNQEATSVDDRSNPNLHRNNVLYDQGYIYDENYRPIWDETTKSLCIDNGNPNTYPGEIAWYIDPLEHDEDGSRLDIGAFPAINAGHRNGVINLEKREQWNWISIPGIDYSGEPRYANKIMNVFNNFRENNLFEGNQLTYTMEQLRFLYNTLKGGVYWDHQFNLMSFTDPNHQVRSQYGYKIQLRNEESVPDFKQIEYDGFQPGNPGNPESALEIMQPVEDGNITCQVNPATGVLERETWLGYFLDKSMDPYVALAPILPQIVSIKAQDWCVARLITTDGHYSETWLGKIEPDAPFVINPGEMVAVRYIGTSDVQFHWGGENPEPPTSPYFKRVKPEHFVYNEKEDYLPIFAYIDLSGYEEGQEPTEMAIYVNGVCKGAEKITGDEIQLKAYILDEPYFETATVEFRFWSPIKSVSETNVTYQVMDTGTGSLSSQTMTLNNRGNYIRVRLDSPDTNNPQLPSVTALIGNYPNPFNPETIIKYSLVKQSKVTLDVFNVKGQKVRTLVNENKAAGFYSSKWDGKDNNGISVSSGVYFYRLNTDKNSLTKKMILLK